MHQTAHVPLEEPALTGPNESLPSLPSHAFGPKDGDAIINASGKYKVKGLALVSVG
jgi:hypothetical protein